MPKYSHLFFDLDRTLWDFNTNSIETLKDIFNKYQLGDSINSFDEFYSVYLVHNADLWNDYRNEKIIKSVLRYQRFALTLEDFGVKPNKIANLMSDDYVTISAQKTNLFPHTVELLDYLKTKYSLYIITNGFKEVQILKLKNCGIYNHFDKVFISEDIGTHKPNKKIFKHALSTANAKKEQSIMIGDDLKIDILGAKNFGIDQIYFNPLKVIHDTVVSYEISSLKELMDIL